MSFQCPLTIKGHWKRQDYQQVTEKKENNLPEEDVVVAEVLAGGIRRREGHIQYLLHVHECTRWRLTASCKSSPVKK